MTEKIEIVNVDCSPQIDPYKYATNGLTITTLYIDPQSKTCRINQEYDDNHTPQSVWHGRTLKLPLASYLDTEKVKAFLHGEEGQSLLQQVCTGHEVYWNGSNNVGVFTDESTRALTELCHEIECLESSYEFWTCSEWTAQLTELGVNAATTDEELRELAKLLEPADRITLIDNMFSYLQSRRDMMID